MKTKTILWLAIFLLSFRAKAASFIPQGTFPKDVSNRWSERVQGLAHDDNNVYLSATEKIWQIPKHISLSVNSKKVAKKLRTFSIPADLKSRGYNHIGDVDCVDGILYVPLEGPAPHLLLLVQASGLQHLKTIAVPSQYQSMFPWVAVNPFNHQIYSSTFNLNQKELINVYELKEEKGQTVLSLVRQVLPRDGAQNPVYLQKLQGGVFSPTHNKLLLVSDTLAGGVYSVDSESQGEILAQQKISYTPGGLSQEELEGIDYWPSAEGTSPNFSGNVHVVNLNNNLFNDGLSILHYIYQD